MEQDNNALKNAKSKLKQYHDALAEWEKVPVITQIERKNWKPMPVDFLDSNELAVLFRNGISTVREKQSHE